MDINAFIARFDAGLKDIENGSPAVARQRYDHLCQTFAPPNPSGMTITDKTWKSLALRHFIPASAQSGQVLYIHGGGFTLGSIDSHHGVAASLAEQLKRHVISISYCLAPEASYHNMLEECLKVAKAAKPIAVVGDSAGGRIAIDLAPLLHRSLLHRSLLHRSLLVGLIYPPVGKLNQQTLGADAPLLSRHDVLSLIPYCPWIDNHVDTFPPEMQIEVLSVEHDPLTAPLEKAIASWRNSGMQVGYRCAKNMVHAALHAHADLPEMQSAWQDFCQALNKRLTQNSSYW
ncbi:alpha/beta hydrolase [Halomonas qinghailakensis]|uniref:Alpha/beta hydrolase n=1 Tax=Halomonas qinghailakensis TaxID=2937790 RepID=A0AA46TP88_9GAMM|nr:alpha/beta hydrolase [Halomonas sp. ZZQ-149]UYO74013.1 alpha/beta hydrolase [Halomonas sp. ZZQ-149]